MTSEDQCKFKAHLRRLSGHFKRVLVSHIVITLLVFTEILQLSCAETIYNKRAETIVYAFKKFYSLPLYYLI